MENVQTLPEQDFSCPNFTRKCVNYAKFTIATKQRKLSAFTLYRKFIYWHNVYLILLSLGIVAQPGYDYPTWVILPSMGGNLTKTG